MKDVRTEDAAELVRALREIAWSDEREAGDETGALANAALRRFAKTHIHLLGSTDFLELAEYIEAQPDAEAKEIFAQAKA